MRISAYRYPSLSSDHLQLNTNNLTYFNFRKIQMENSFLGVLQRFPVIRIRPSSELTLTRVSKVSNISFQSLPPPLVLHKNYCVYCNLFTASKRYNCCQKMMRYVDMHSRRKDNRSFLNHHQQHHIQNNGQQEPEALQVSMYSQSSSSFVVSIQIGSSA